MVPAVRGVVGSSTGGEWVSGQLIKSLKLLLAALHGVWLPSSFPTVLVGLLVERIEDHAFLLVYDWTVEVLALVLGHVGVVL